MPEYIIECSSNQNGECIGGKYVLKRLPLFQKFIKVFKLKSKYDEKYLKLTIDHESNRGIGELVFSLGKSKGLRISTYYRPSNYIDLLLRCIYLFIYGC